MRLRPRARTSSEGRNSRTSSQLLRRSRRLRRQLRRVASRNDVGEDRRPQSCFGPLRGRARPLDPRRASASVERLRAARGGLPERLRARPRSRAARDRETVTRGCGVSRARAPPVRRRARAATSPAACHGAGPPADAGAASTKPAATSRRKRSHGPLLGDLDLEASRCLGHLSRDRRRALLRRPAEGVGLLRREAPPRLLLLLELGDVPPQAVELALGLRRLLSIDLRDRRLDARVDDAEAAEDVSDVGEPRDDVERVALGASRRGRSARPSTDRSTRSSSGPSRRRP